MSMAPCNTCGMPYDEHFCPYCAKKKAEAEEFERINASYAQAHTLSEILNSLKRIEEKLTK